MELEIGMYVRTIQFGIGKVTKLNGGRYTLNVGKKHYIPFTKDILKSSQNIIDLIEVGDYVNGNKVDEIDYEVKGIWLDNRKSYNDSITNEDIKEILTKESYNNNCYKIGE